MLVNKQKEGKNLMKIKKLTQIPYGQCHVEIVDKNNVVLFSHYTLVAKIENGWFSILNGLYSMTTKKHIGAFAKEYANIPYKVVKQLHEDKMMLNINTGEVVEKRG